MTNDDSLLDRYDQLYSRMVHLRLIACGADNVLESCRNKICKLLKEQNNYALLEEFQDIGNAIVWIQEELKKPILEDTVVAPMKIPF